MYLSLLKIIVAKNVIVVLFMLERILHIAFLIIKIITIHKHSKVIIIDLILIELIILKIINQHLIQRD
jgi:hypothetical protein